MVGRWRIQILQRKPSWERFFFLVWLGKVYPLYFFRLDWFYGPGFPHTPNLSYWDDEYMQLKMLIKFHRIWSVPSICSCSCFDNLCGCRVWQRNLFPRAYLLFTLLGAINQSSNPFAREYNAIVNLTITHKSLNSWKWTVINIIF